jgi:hypothetical protein
LVISSLILFFYAPTVSWAGINQEINRQTPFNNFTDSLATLGKSPGQKTAIKNSRRLTRSQARLKKLQQANSRRAHKPDP